MRKKIVFIFTLLLNLNCNAQNCNNNIQKEYNMEKIMKIPEINADYEVFDREAFFFGKDQHNQKREHKQRVVNNDTVNCYATMRSYEEYGKNGSVRKRFFRGHEGDTYGHEYTTNPLIGIYKEFYPNEGIKEKGIYCWFGFKMGLWYYYDEVGNLIKVENTDEEFEFTAEDIFAYCLENNIPLEMKEGDFRTKIRKYNSVESKSLGLGFDKPFWFIKYPVFTEWKTIIIHIDAKTGKIVRTFEESLNSTH